MNFWLFLNELNTCVSGSLGNSCALNFFLLFISTSYLMRLVALSKTIILIYRETWYYGLQYEDSKGNIVWLKTDKKVLDQHHLPPLGKYQI